MACVGIAVVWEYVSSANDKEKKDAAAKAKRKEEQALLAEALQVRSGLFTRTDTRMLSRC